MGVTTTRGTLLKGCSTGKVENHCSQQLVVMDGDVVQLVDYLFKCRTPWPWSLVPHKLDMTVHTLQIILRCKRSARHLLWVTNSYGNPTNSECHKGAHGFRVLLWTLVLQSISILDQMSHTVAWSRALEQMKGSLSLHLPVEHVFYLAKNLLPNFSWWWPYVNESPLRIIRVYTDSRLHC